ncbi:MAG TPA: carbohydrate ABC transporter permease [Gaiellaceae bacterium]|nr:carbohydrate ABC transporter permease [Gaiellaceae bacterium]
MTSIGEPIRAGGPTPDIPPMQPVVPEPLGRPRRPATYWVTRAIFVAVLLFFSLLFLYPFLWVLSASLKSKADVFDNRLIPKTWHFHNYVHIWHAAPFLRWFLNSAYIDIAAAVSVTFVSSIVAFAFAYFRFPLRNFFFGCVLATMMLPGAVTMIPVYLIWHHFGLATSQFPLWGTNLFGSAFYIFLQRQFFLGIPREYFEAARMDGDNYFTMFWRIALPLAKPALIVTALFEFKAKWTDLMTPLIYLRSDSQFTIPRGLFALLGQWSPQAGGNGDYEWLMAAMVLSTLPMIIIFFFAQRYFIEGISLQGRKG